MSKLVRGAMQNDHYWIISDRTPVRTGERLIASGSNAACQAALRLMKTPTREHVEAARLRRIALRAARKSGRVSL